MGKWVEKVLRRFGYAKIQEHVVIKEQHFNIERLCYQEHFDLIELETKLIEFELRNGVPKESVYRYIKERIGSRLSSELMKHCDYDIAKDPTTHGYKARAIIYIAKKK